MTAKRIFLVAVVCMIGLVPILQAENPCTAATLSGDYGFSGNGFDVVSKSASPSNHSSNSALAPVAFVGRLSAAGDGTLSGSFTATGNGHMETAAPFTGAYVVNADCTGLMAVMENDGHESHFAMAITDGGKEILAIQTDAGTARTFVVKKQ
jgi:hypothetical protein